MTPASKRLAEVRARVEKAMPGPWRFDRDNHNVYANGLLAQTYGHIHNGERLATAELIAHSPSDLRDLSLGLEVALEMIEKLADHDGGSTLTANIHFAREARARIEEILGGENGD